MRQRRHHQQHHRVRTSASAAAVLALAMVAGASATAGADDRPGRSETQKKARAGAPKTPAPATGTRQTVTLITGDRVTVDENGRVARVQPAEGREKTTFRTRTFDGRTFVIPRDAEPLIAAGKVDRTLFDLTELTRPEARKAYGKSARALVTYEGRQAAAAKAGVRAADRAAVQRALPAVNAEAVSTDPERGSALWDALTGRTGKAKGAAKGAAVAPGVEKIWLDAIVTPSLDRSTAQIGAPAAWARSYDGAGVKIAVLDTGMDDTHPDLAGKIAAARNFTDSPDTRDGYNHGTHVASIAAGTGAASNGKYKGVAPGATLLNGKVLDEWGGTTSGIIAGIDWAVAQGADIVNMSLGRENGPEIDPVEEAVNRYSAEKGVLFAVAAGNLSPGHDGIATPASAEAALTIGAVDHGDKLADLSARGPERYEGLLKPDVTAPGVNVTAAVPTANGQAGYAAKSGTSMAAPHAAGAAALLKQKNPTWNGAALKAALMGSAEPGPYTRDEQGTGRIAVDRALDLPLFAETTAVYFGKQVWPHHDNTPLTKKVTYRNTGTVPVTLDLELTGATSPSGKPVPAGFFALGSRQLTVPAGGTASVNLTTDTRIEGGGEGRYTAVVTATGGGRTFRTHVTVEREIESYDVTLKAVARDGSPDTRATANLFGYSGLGKGLYQRPDLSTGSVTLRLPKGDYFLDGSSTGSDTRRAQDLMWQPRVVVDRPLVLTLDSRATKPVKIDVPDATAVPVLAGLGISLDAPGYASDHGVLQESFEGLRTAQIGGGTPEHPLSQVLRGEWRTAGSSIHTISGGLVDRLSTGYTKQFTEGELAAVTVRSEASAAGKTHTLTVGGQLPGTGVRPGLELPALPSPGERTVRVSAPDSAAWSFKHVQYGSPTAPRGEVEHQLAVPRRFTPGKPHTVTLNTGAQAPTLAPGYGVLRERNSIQGRIPLVGDGEGNPGLPRTGTADTTLHKDGVLVGRTDDPLTGRHWMEVPAEPGIYTLATKYERPTSVATAATRVEGKWTFPSAHSTERTWLPVSVVRFAAEAGPDATAPAGRTQTFPLLVQGAAAGKNGKSGKNLKSLTAEVSYDEGLTWRPLAVKGGKVTVTNPAKGKGISFRGEVVDRQGNKGSVTVINAYLGG
ncbi:MULTISPECIES: S8 family peptidase [Streptomyces]|uniref:S8 family peptidase n=1 Tax=Streptomyces TaxID=1883 RepID=UPI0002ED81F6|nr:MULTISPECIES: S8 family serine peptidase [Streptomyces]